MTHGRRVDHQKIALGIHDQHVMIRSKDIVSMSDMWLNDQLSEDIDLVGNALYLVLVGSMHLNYDME